MSEVSEIRVPSFDPHSTIASRDREMPHATIEEETDTEPESSDVSEVSEDEGSTDSADDDFNKQPTYLKPQMEGLLNGRPKSAAVARPQSASRHHYFAEGSAPSPPPPQIMQQVTGIAESASSRPRSAPTYKVQQNRPQSALSSTVPSSSSSRVVKKKVKKKVVRTTSPVRRTPSKPLQTISEKVESAKKKKMIPKWVQNKTTVKNSQYHFLDPEQMYESLMQAKRKVSELESEMRKLRTENERNVEALNKKDKQMKELLTSKASFEKKGGVSQHLLSATNLIRSLKQANKDLQHQMKEKDNLIKKLGNDSRQTRADQLEEQVHYANQEILRLQMTLQDYKKAKRGASSGITGSEVTDNLIRRVRELEKEVETAYASAESDVVRKLGHENARLKEELAAIKAQNRMLSGDNETELRSLRHEISALRESMGK